MLKAIEYWNKVIDDKSQPFGTKVLRDEYEIKSTWTINNTLENLKKRYKNHPRMTIKDDCIIEDKGRQYGIHSYIEIKRG